METPSAASIENPSIVTSKSTTTAPTDPINSWLDRVTGRFAVDRELQLEIRLELRSHVDESIAEFLAAGRTEAESRDEALRALGDEAELSTQLWRANRRRMKLRALAVWAARLVLTPVAITLALILSLGTLTSWAVLTSSSSPGVSENFPGEKLLAQRAKVVATANVSPDVRLLIDQIYADADQQLPLARRLVEMSPDDLPLRANLAGAASQDTGVNVVWPEPPATAERGTPIDGPDDTVTFGPPPPKPDPIITVDEPKLAATLAVYADGERRDPGNALYAMLEAALLFEASSFSRTSTAHAVRWPGDTEPTDAEEIVVTNPARYAVAVAASRRAATKPYFRSYTADLVRRRVDALPARTIQDLTVRAAIQPGRNSGWVWYSGLGAARFAPTWSGAEAVRLARAGAPAGVVDPLLDDTRTLARLMTADAESLLELRWAFSAYFVAESDEAWAWAARGDKSRADACWMRYLTLNDRANNSRIIGSSFDYELSGLLSRPDYARRDAIDTTPMRRAEYAAIDQLGFGALSASLLVLAGLYGLLAFVRWVMVRRAAIAPRLFVGWRRCAAVVLIGVVAPVSLYLAYAWLTPLGGRDLGLNATLIRVSIEYAVLGGVVLLLVSVLAGWAAVARMRELRLKPPPSMVLRNATSDWPRPAAVALGLALAFVVVALFMKPIDREFLRPMGLNFGSDAWLAQVWELAAAAALVALAIGLRWGESRARSTAAGVPQPAGVTPQVSYGWYARAAFAPLLLASLAVCAIGLPLRLLEARAVRAAVATGQPVVYLGLADRSVLKDVRDELLTTGHLTTTPAEVQQTMSRYAEQQKRMREMTP